MINIWISFSLVCLSCVLAGFCLKKKNNFKAKNSHKWLDSAFKLKETNVVLWKILLILTNYILWVLKDSWWRGNKYSPSATECRPIRRQILCCLRFHRSQIRIGALGQILKAGKLNLQNIKYSLIKKTSKSTNSSACISKYM